MLFENLDILRLRLEDLDNACRDAIKVIQRVQAAQGDIQLTAAQKTAIQQKLGAGELQAAYNATVAIFQAATVVVEKEGE